MPCSANKRKRKKGQRAWAFVILLLAPVPAFAAAITRTDVVLSAANGVDMTAISSPAAVAGDTCVNDGQTLYRIQNDHAANAYTVTFDATEIRYGQPVTDKAVAVAALGDRLVGPFPVATFGRVLTVTYTGAAVAADLDVACYRVQRAD